MKQKGFTLIELVIVIVILGILAATALPKFIDLSKDARSAALRAVDGSMRAANTLIYAKAAIGGVVNTTGQMVSVNGGNVTVAYGFAQDMTNLLAAMDVGADFTTNNAAYTSGTPSVTNGGGYIQFTKAATPASCRVAYVMPAGAGQSPTYTLTDSGC